MSDHMDGEHQASAEERDQPEHKGEAVERVVEHILRQMDTSMMQLLNTESIGGNAGSVEIEGRKYTCAGANGYADPETGQIVTFGNIQNVPDSIVSAGSHFLLRLAIDFRDRGFYRIVNISTDRRLSSTGREALEESIRRWNEQRA